MKEQQKQNSNEQENHGRQNSEYKNIETSVNNPSSFDDDYAAQQEDKIAQQDRRPEEEGRPGRS